MKKGKTDAANVGVRLGVDVIEFLRHLEVSHGCSRSFLINAIVREYAERQAADDAQPGSEFANPMLAKVIEM